MQLMQSILDCIRIKGIPRIDITENLARCANNVDDKEIAAKEQEIATTT